MSNYGKLLTPDAKLHRTYFAELVKLIGIQVIYRAPKPGKKWTTYGELDSNFQDPIKVGCIFDEHPTQSTMKMLGWVAELNKGASVISVPYNLPDLQVGALFVVPSAIDGAEGRLFRVHEMYTTMVYPSSVSCKILPEFEDTYDSAMNDFRFSSFNALQEEGGGNLFENTV